MIDRITEKMKKLINAFLLLLVSLFIFTGCSENPNIIKSENSVKIKRIESTVNLNRRAVYRKSEARIVSEDDINYIVIYKSQTDITFTITLDNPESYAIDALRVYCDDPDAMIMVDNEYKKIRQEADGTRVVNWSSEDPYEKTYNIITTSQDSINSFKVVDIRLAGHEKFQSKETESEDLGNNELKIFKIDDDILTVNCVENNIGNLKYNFKVKEGYEDFVRDIRVNGELPNEDGYWETTSNNYYNKISYNYCIDEYKIADKRTFIKEILPLECCIDENQYFNDLFLFEIEGELENVYSFPFCLKSMEVKSIDAYYGNEKLTDEYFSYSYNYYILRIALRKNFMYKINVDDSSSNSINLFIKDMPTFKIVVTINESCKITFECKLLETPNIESIWKANLETTLLEE